MLILLAVVLSLYRPEISADIASAKYRTPESRYIDIGGTSVHIRIRGKGPGLILIHGSFSSLHTWQPWEDSLSRKFTTLSMDLPGHGLTGPDAHEDYSQDHYADIVFSLANQLKLDTFIVAGNSMGGNIAYRMALKHPERISKLILIDAAGAPSDTTFRLIPASNRPFIFKMLEIPVLRNSLTRLTPRFLFKSVLNGVFHDPGKITEAMTDRYYELMRRAGNRDATAVRIATMRSPTPDGTVTCPTLILWGADDNWIPVSTGKRFHAAIPGSKLFILKETGHVPMEERPYESLAIVKNFLNN